MADCRGLCAATRSGTLHYAVGKEKNAQLHTYMYFPPPSIPKMCIAFLLPDLSHLLTLFCLNSGVKHTNVLCIHYLSKHTSLPLLIHTCTCTYAVHSIHSGSYWFPLSIFLSFKSKVATNMSKKQGNLILPPLFSDVPHLSLPPHLTTLPLLPSSPEMCTLHTHTHEVGDYNTHLIRTSLGWLMSAFASINIWTTVPWPRSEAM